MFTTNHPALTRPRHAFDLPGATVWSLAVTGRAMLLLAHALDTNIDRRAPHACAADRPRARLGPAGKVHTDHLIPNTWRVR